MKPQLTVTVGQYSSAGKKSLNQDFHGVLIPQEPLLSTKGIAIGLADGISSSNVSQIASETAIKQFLQDYYCTSECWSVKTSVQNVVAATNSWLYSQTQSSPYRFDKDKGYICTFSALVIKSNTAHIFHCGDSRIYRLTGRTLEQLTIDHRHVVSDEASYLTRALGIHHWLDMDYNTLSIDPGDVFILVTDGVYEFVSTSQMSEIIASQFADNPDAAAKALVQAALDAGSDDNLTVQVLRVDRLPGQQLGEIHELLQYPPPVSMLKPRTLFDGFLILRELHITSRSHVFLAQDEASGTRVVIKTPSGEMKDNQAYLENFLMEDWIAKRINNVHVLKAFPLERKRQYLYNVTEFIEGKTLTQWMLDNPQPSLDEVRNIIEQIAKGLQAFHRLEMVHQDLRPHNVMIDQSGTVKIIDFGSTRVAGVSEILGPDTEIMGTVQYTAPEYFIGQPGSNRSDIFSLGVIAYQMLSGTHPYGTHVARATSLKAQRQLRYQPLLNVNKEHPVPGWVDYAIKKAVDINPLHRYAEVSEFIYELKNPAKTFLNQTAPPLIDRNPVLFWQSVSFILLLLLLWQQVR